MRATRLQTKTANILTFILRTVARYRLATSPASGNCAWSYPHVLDATQLTSRKVQTKYENTPYSVSLTEWECLSTARKTFTQKAQASNTTTPPCQETGQ
jgi:hypothetical protein